MKQAIEIIHSEETFANLKTFTDVERLNQAVRQYKDMITDMDLRQDLKRNLLTIIECIKRYSCRFFGVSWRGKRKIAAELNMSDKTVTRLCKQLESLGFIKQYAMKRSSDMRQTSNAIVIQPVPVKAPKSENVRQGSVKMSDQENNISLKQNIINTINTYQPAAPVTFYQQFKHLIGQTIGENQPLTSRLFGIYKAHTNVLVRYNAYSKEYVEKAGYEALKRSLMDTKTKKIRHLPGYFNGVLNKTLDRMFYDEMAQLSSEC